MAFSYSQSIMPMSVLRSDPERVKRRMRHSPVIITNKGTPDFGVCDLETLQIAVRIRELRDLLKERRASREWEDADEVRARLLGKYATARG